MGPLYLCDDEFAGRILFVTEFLSETQGDATLRGVAPIAAEHVQLYGHGHTHQTIKPTYSINIKSKSAR